MADVYVYRTFALLQAAGASPVDWENDAIRLMLVTDSYTPDWDADEFWDDASANELANGDGYTTNGATIANIAVTLNTTDDRAEVDGDDVSWTFTADKTFRYAIMVKWTGVASTSSLIGAIDYGASSRTENGTFIVQHPTNGFFRFTIASGQ